ncbi:glutathione-dependent reductase [Bowdeniella nasicola]|uniref:Glutathione-dependent reductase n=1 Tax=Bowdeniella nasicola TaxID=208480 RepID=A0A1Q5Q0Q8_9ACTO|nr:glutathione S-transferase C-terminal domain-containing protein [Bowdeniella nasicola]OKL53453.1 glutathione-dependent reductase [Bowdeniella nasicola]
MTDTDTGTFDRDTRYISDRITTDVPPGSAPVGAKVGEMTWPVEAGRYHLAGARACPWAHRAIIARALMGLDDVISLGLAGPTHDEHSWTFDLDPGGKDPVLGIERLQEAYFNRVPDYPLGITVPAMVDIPTVAVVTNDFDQLSIDLATQWGAFANEDAPELYADAQRDEIEAINARVYPDLNNGVYQAGFATSQSAYDDAYQRVFATLAWLEEHLANRRYLVGDSITLADIRLYATLVRFDPVYHGHFKCNRQTISSMPVLSAYLRDLYQTPGFGDTTDIDQIKEHYYVVHTNVNPTQIVPHGPELSWLMAPHGREDLP